jgi:hypothetical protein
VLLPGPGCTLADLLETFAQIGEKRRALVFRPARSAAWLK